MFEAKIKHVIFNFITRILKSSISLFFLPIIIANFDELSLAIYFYIFSVISLSMSIDLGLGQLMIRTISKLYSGSINLENNDQIYDLEDKNRNIKIFINIKQLLKKSKKIYFFITLILFILLSTLGTISYLNFVKSYSSYFVIFWILTIISLIENVYFGRWHLFLFGIGESKYASLSILATKSLLLILVFIFRNDLNLILFFIFVFITGFFERFLCKFFFNKTLLKNLEIEKNFKFENEIYKFNDLANVKMRYLIIGNINNSIYFINTVLLFNIGPIILANFIGAVKYAQYGFTMNFMSLILTLSMIYFWIFSPKIIELTLLKKIMDKYKLFFVLIVLETITMVFGVLFLLLIENIIYYIFGDNTSILNSFEIIIIGIVFLIENLTNRFIFLFQIIDDYSYNLTYTISSLTIIVLTIILLVFTNLSIISFYLSILVVRLLPVNLFWILKSIRLIIKNENRLISNIYNNRVK
jgi:hypothetical protein